MKSVFPVLTLCVALATAGCGPAAPGEAPLAGARIGGPFALTNQDGKTVRDTDFAGKYRIVYFGYTYCPDVCPTDMAKIGQAMRQLDREAPATADKIVPIFISIDPERDKPAQLKSFVGNFYPRLVGLTGSVDAIKTVARNYAVAFNKQPTPSGYLMGHTAVAYLMGPEGKPITSLPLEKDSAAVADELKRWVR
ncbi:SCO family protein [Sphingomonas sp. RS6]